MVDVREVYGIGSKKATELRKYYNIRTVYALRKYTRKIPDIITDAQRTGLKYHDKISKSIGFDEAEKHIKFILKVLPSAVIAGSYRREEKRINDIDVLVIEDLKYVLDALKDKGYMVAILAMGDEKMSGIGRLPGTSSYRRIDVIKTTEVEKPFALLYFTGDFVQNISMRQKAKKMKYCLSQRSLTNNKTGKAVASIKTEKDIFDFLKIAYKKPNERSHKGIEKTTLGALSK